MTFAPILTTFSLSVAKDQRSISPGKGRVRRIRIEGAVSGAIDEG